MRYSKIAALFLCGVMSISMQVGCNGHVAHESAENIGLSIAKQGIFSAGGTVMTSDGIFDVVNYYTSREGSTSHVDHANVLYQIPTKDTGLPMIFLDFPPWLRSVSQGLDDYPRWA